MQRELAKFKPSQSRSLVIKKDQITDYYKYTVVGTNIPNLSEKTIKKLRKDIR